MKILEVILGWGLILILATLFEWVGETGLVFVFIIFPALMIIAVILFMASGYYEYSKEHKSNTPEDKEW